MLFSKRHIPLGFFPTPVVELSKLSDILGGPRISMKRDDLTGLALGGNKTRKLEFILQDALDRNIDTVITAGAAQSNHCRQTAAAAAMLGLECHLLLGGQAPAMSNGNLMLDELLSANIHWCGENRKGEDIPTLVAELEQAGRRPYVIPYGGSNHLGAYGFVNALYELEQQIETNKITHIIFASSSGGTHAGLIVGKTILEQSYEIVGIEIDKEELAGMSYADALLELTNTTAESLDLKARYCPEDIVLNDNYIGGGYGVVGELEKEAIQLVAQHEAILLDPVYTGRAFGGMIDMIRSGELSKEHNVLFWHTGGAPALFAYAQSIR
ncbi:MAG: D-cysteine desulfhydrase family protein [Kangiellaceae bacterium]|jgi:D-cysteine desulfhydrase|nr:D-cysteine desulfhydrase family protein [Kangiellaceae bacterium]